METDENRLPFISLKSCLRSFRRRLKCHELDRSILDGFGITIFPERLLRI